MTLISPGLVRSTTKGSPTASQLPLVKSAEGLKSMKTSTRFSKNKSFISSSSLPKHSLISSHECSRRSSRTFLTAPGRNKTISSETKRLIFRSETKTTLSARLYRLLSKKGKNSSLFPFFSSVSHNLFSGTTATLLGLGSTLRSLSC